MTPELLSYAEKAGAENMKERVEVSTMIQKEANTTLTMLMAGAGAALGYAANTQTNKPIALAAFAVSLYLFFLCVLVVSRCLALVSFPASANEPKNLTHDQYTLDQIRAWELENLQTRIDEAVLINEQRSGWLDRCRYAAAFTPIVSVVVWAAAR